MSSSSWEVFIGAIITRHIGQLVLKLLCVALNINLKSFMSQQICNGHAISDFEINNFGYFTSASCIAKGKLFMSIESQRIFTAIFPRISLFNHSCDPNIRNRFNDKELVIYSRRAINNGEEVLNCYGPNSKLNLRLERQELLDQQYHFHCDCVSCKGADEDYVSFD